jgi:hypothetical protein
MLLHLNFCIEWFDSNSKEDSKYFENALKCCEKKKKRKFFSLSAFGPAQPSSHRSPAACLPPARVARLPFPVSPLGPSPASASSLAHASARFPFPARR